MGKTDAYPDTLYRPGAPANNLVTDDAGTAVADNVILRGSNTSAQGSGWTIDDNDDMAVGALGDKIILDADGDSFIYANVDDTVEVHTANGQRLVIGSSNIECARHTIPRSNNTYTLGNASRRWLELHMANIIYRGVTAGITASTTQTQGEGALTTEVNEVSTVANPNDTVTLPTAAAGAQVIIVNNGASTLQIFPASGDDLGSGVDTATTLATGQNVRYVAYDATNWVAA